MKAGEETIGKFYSSGSEAKTLHYARLKAGRGSSGKLVSRIRQRASQTAGIKKADINNEICAEIHRIAEKNNTEVLAEIPFDENAGYAVSKGITLAEHGVGKAYDEIKILFTKLQEKIKKNERKN